MIDIRTESLVRLRDTPDILPRKRGKKVHVSTVFRWATEGLRGFRLETKRAGGAVYTSREALARFFDLLTHGEHEPGEGKSDGAERAATRDRLTSDTLSQMNSWKAGEQGQGGR